MSASQRKFKLTGKCTNLLKTFRSQTQQCNCDEASKHDQVNALTFKGAIRSITFGDGGRAISIYDGSYGERVINVTSGSGSWCGALLMAYCFDATALDTHSLTIEFGLDGHSLLNSGSSGRLIYPPRI